MQPNQLPLWVLYVQALGPTVSVIAALTAGYIALRQWWTAHDRLRVDMYERRSSVYEATKRLLSTVTLHGTPAADDMHHFYEGTRGAEFLFDGDTRNFVMTIRDKAFKAKMTHASYERNIDHPRADKLSSQEEDISDYLREQDANLEKLFGRYLDLSKIGLL
jgi:hypothetical protein